MILCLIFVAALGECSPAAHGSTEVRDASFGVRERCWNARGDLPASHSCSSGSSVHAGGSGNGDRQGQSWALLGKRSPAAARLLGGAVQGRDGEVSLSQPVEPGVGAHGSRERTSRQTSCLPGVGGDCGTTGVVRSASKVTLSR